jgi:NAD(P)-dependent dehydrogenase (short-subunit alcohol dehydrogenase family)
VVLVGPRRRQRDRADEARRSHCRCRRTELKPESKSGSQTPSLRLDGRVAVVTGAGRGIGRGCALALAEAGADVMLMARSSGELEETASEVRATGQNVQTIVCDVTDSRQVEEAVDFLEHIDVLVNNAGTNVPEPFLEVSEENLDKMLAVNVKGVFMVAQAAARRMVERGEGGSSSTSRPRWGT